MEKIRSLIPAISLSEAVDIILVAILLYTAIVWAPLQSFFGRGLPQRLTDWTTAFVDGEYRLHAYVVTDERGNHALRRVAPGTDTKALVAQQQPWATIFVRAESGRAD